MNRSTKARTVEKTLRAARARDPNWDGSPRSTLISELTSTIEPATGMKEVVVPMSRLRKWLRLAKKADA